MPYFTALANNQFTLELWAKQPVPTPNVQVVSSSDGTTHEYGIDVGGGYWEGDTQQYSVGQPPAMADPVLKVTIPPFTPTSGPIL